MSAKFEKLRLRQARALKRMTLADVGVRADLTRQSLSQYENGDRTPPPETLAKLAQILDVPLEFLLRPIGSTESSSRSIVHYRSLRRTRQLILEQQRASAVLDLCAAMFDSFQEYIDYLPSRVPQVDHNVDVLSLDGEEIEQIANRTRKELGLGLGPISDVTLMVENLSVVVVNYPLPEGMDGLSAYYGERPFIVVSSEAPYARSRMNVAHEFGHLVLHGAVGDGVEMDFETFKLVESQAWRFAGALLLPADSFLKDVYSTSLDALLLLKEKWGVSVAAIIRRLDTLGILDREQVKYLNIQLRQRQWSKAEPGDDKPRERARLFNRTAEYLGSRENLRLDQLVEEFRLPSNFVASGLEVDPEALNPRASENVIQFRPRR